MRIKYLFVLAIVMIGLSVNSMPSYSNDTALSAEGQNIGPYEGTPDVVLDNEVINLDISPGKTIVNITFNLRNEGPTKTILVGFPDEEASSRLKNNVDYAEANYQGPIEAFKAFVNGAAVKTTTKTQVKKGIIDDYPPPGYNVLWHVWPVEFKKGKTTVIKNTYWVQNGVNVMGEKNFHYTLITGAKWKGKIGRTKIIANFKDNLSTHDIIKEGTTKGMKIVSPTQAVWEFKNFEPGPKNEELGYFAIIFRHNLSLVARTRNLTESDLKGLSDWELKCLRNEIYARHGRKFKDEGLQGYYNSFSWYKVNPKYSDNMLNAFEKRNAQFILQYEKKIGSKIIY